MLTLILLAVWVLLFAPLVIIPVLPNVDGPRVMRAPRAVTEQKVITLATSHTEHAA